MDVTIAFMGLSPLLEGEEGEAILSDNGDRTDIRLPENQVSYLRRLASSGGKIVLVLSGGSPVALEGLEEIVDAILYVWYPGQEGGRAVADVLFGDHAPSGKLPLTFPASMDQLPPFEDYEMAGRTYRYMTEEPLFPFGFGLSYSTFAYSDLTLANGSLKCGRQPANRTGRDEYRLARRGRGCPILLKRSGSLCSCSAAQFNRFRARIAGCRRK